MYDIDRIPNIFSTPPFFVLRIVSWFIILLKRFPEYCRWKRYILAGFVICVVMNPIARHETQPVVAVVAVVDCCRGRWRRYAKEEIKIQSCFWCFFLRWCCAVPSRTSV